MGLTGKGLNRFRKRVDSVLEDMFPVTLLIDGHTYQGSGPGARIATEFTAGGERQNFRFPFRVPKSRLAKGPAVGDSLVWKVDDLTEILLEVIEIATRPHEDRWSFTCRKRLT